MENTLLELTADKKLELVNQTKKRLDSSLKYYSSKRDVWRTCYKIYRAIKDEKDNDDEPNAAIPVAFGLIQDIVARKASTRLGKLSIQVKPKKPTHQKSAENFFNMCRSYYGSSDYRESWIPSTLEECIVGSGWEFDDWASEYEKGYRWGFRKVMAKASELMPTLAAMAENMGLMAALREFGKQEQDFPICVGYQTNFPSIFRVHPQPGVKKVQDLKWIIEVIPFMALDDLRKAKYVIDGVSVNVFDLSELDALKKNAGDKLIKPEYEVDDGNKDFESEYMGVDNTEVDYDVDGVHIMKVRTPDAIYYIANGKHVISHITRPYFKPGIKARLRRYTVDNEGLYGWGVIEPMIDLFEELDDVHNMAMENWVRIIHKLILYNEELVPYPDDFNPRAGGRVRVKGASAPLRDAFYPVDQPDVTGTMITTEQNLRGYLGSVAAVSDMTPGPMGTKPYHETYGGLMEIQTQFARRFTITAVLDQAAQMKQMAEMYWLYDQFMFQPMSFSRFDKGSAGAIEYTREDIDTEGMGFEYFASDDPSFGDPTVRRNQSMVLMDRVISYETFRMNSRDGVKMKICHVDKLLEKVFEAFGYNDVSEYLSEPDGVIDPQTEYELMLKGVPVEVNPMEPLTKHYIAHYLQKIDLERGQQAPPETVAALLAHLEETAAAISAIVARPEMFAIDQARKQIISERAAAGQQGPILQQNMPAPRGSMIPPAALAGGAGAPGGRPSGGL